MGEEGGNGIRYDYSCRQDDNIIPLSNLPDGFEGFAFDLRFSNKIEKANGDKALMLNSYRRVIHMSRRASMEDDSDNIEFGLYLELSIASIPERVKYLIIDAVVNFARSMVEENNTDNNDEKKKEKDRKKVFPIAVDIVVKNLQRASESEDEAISRALSESLDDMIGDIIIPPCVNRREFIETIIAHEMAREGISREDVDLANTNAEEVAAVKSSIQSFLYMRAYDLCSMDGCYICRKNFSCGMVVARLPCSHVYHTDCLSHLLMRGCSCPTCTDLCPMLADSVSNFS